METSVEDLKGWFKQGKAEGATHMVVVCDSFDYEDYPVFCHSVAEARAKAAKPGEMQRVMEVYNLSKPFDQQETNGRLAFDYGEPPKVKKHPCPCGAVWDAHFNPDTGLLEPRTVSCIIADTKGLPNDDKEVLDELARTILYALHPDWKIGQTTLHLFDEAKTIAEAILGNSEFVIQRKGRLK